MLQKVIKNYSDEQLVAEMLNGAEFAFDEIHARYAHKMYMYAFNILNKKQECEDIIQNIFITLWLKREGINIQNLASYLFKAVKFQVFNYFRSNKISDEDLKRLNIIDISNTASKNMEFEELEASIDKSVQMLPNRCKKIFILSRFEHKSHKEIAKELNISVQGVKNQISKALKIIKNSLHKESLLFFMFFYKK